MTLFRKHALILGLLNVSLIALLYSIFSDNDSKPKHNFLLKHEDISTDQNVSLQIETKSHLQWKRNPRCSFRVPSLNRKVPFTCGRGSFVSVVKSVCKTQLGNQLSSYAALLYFTVKHGYHAFLDPVQTRAIGLVFKKEKLTIGQFNYYACGCMPGAQHWVRPLQLHRTGVAIRMTPGWDPRNYSTNHLIGLGPHSVPLFLIKEYIVIGVHARRGDKLRVWRETSYTKDILGKYEGNFFRYSMSLMRKRYNSETRKVVFIVTSDNVHWSKSQLGNSSDTFFSSDYTRAPPTGPTSMGVDLAVLSLADHTIMDYGTFGLWGGLLATGTIIAPTGYTRGAAMSPDMVWWRAANMSNVELVDVNKII